MRSQLSPSCYKRPIVAAFTRPMVVTPALLRLDPFWDPLRSDPLSKNFARKSSHERPGIFVEPKRRNITN